MRSPTHVQRFKRGHVRAKNKGHLMAMSHARFMQHLKSIPPATQPTFDARTLNIIGPIKDQSQCGSCWAFSGTFVVEVALYKAGVLVPDGSQALSEEYTLDCGQNGGCNGDDNTTVLAWAKATGLPLTSAYGPYTAGNGNPGTCAYTPSMKLYQITDWGFSDSNGGQGITATQDIKNCVAYYGCVGCAVAADDAWDAYTGGILSGSDTSIDHDVGIVGWDDTQSGGVWFVRNSWGTSWGEAGYARIPYGNFNIGTEAVFAYATGPTPPPPGPVPPPPPGPTPPGPTPPGPIPGTGYSGTITYTYVNGILTAVVSGSSVSAIPPWLLPILKGACALASTLTGWELMVAMALCAMLPAAERSRTASRDEVQAFLDHLDVCKAKGPCGCK